MSLVGSYSLDLPWARQRLVQVCLVDYANTTVVMTHTSWASDETDKKVVTYEADCDLTHYITVNVDYLAKLVINFNNCVHCKPLDRHK